MNSRKEGSDHDQVPYAPHTEEIMDLLDKTSYCLSEIGNQLELLDGLREDIEGEFEENRDDIFRKNLRVQLDPVG